MLTSKLLLIFPAPVESRGYLLVHSNGGLNQMRAGVCKNTNSTLCVRYIVEEAYFGGTAVPL